MKGDVASMSGDPTQGSRRLSKLAAGALVLVVPAGAWLLAHRLGTRRARPDPWRDEVLPAVPDAAQNGLDDVLLTPSFAGERPSSALQDLVARLDGDTPEARWAMAARAHAELRGWLREEGPQEARARSLSRIDAALAAPRFADPCVSLELDCRPMNLLDLARVASVADLDAALHGDWASALDRATAWLRASNDLLRTSRTVLDAATGALFSLVASDHLRVLVAGLRAAQVEDPDAPAPGMREATRAALEAAIDGSTRADVDLRRVVVGEQRRVRPSLLAALRGGPGAGGDGLGAARFLLDPADTVATLDADFEALRAWAEAPPQARGAWTVPRHAEGAGWWLWNPGGKRLLDTLSYDAGAAITQLESLTDEAFASRAALRDALAAMPR